MAAMSQLGEIGDVTEAPSEDDVAHGPFRSSDGAGVFGVDWRRLHPFFLARDSNDGGERAFLDLENLVVQATMSKSLRKWTNAWDSSV